MDLSLNLHQNSFSLKKAFQQITSLRSKAEWIGLRLYHERQQNRSYRDSLPEANQIIDDRGVMIEVCIGGHLGYSGTADLSESGLHKAFLKACELAEACRQYKLNSFSPDLRPGCQGHYQSPYFISPSNQDLKELSNCLKKATQTLKISDSIISSVADVNLIETDIEYITSTGTHTEQKFMMMTSHFQATAKKDGIIQSRSDHGPVAVCLQSGLELLDPRTLFPKLEKIAQQALELVDAPNCPNDTRDLLLAPDQLLLQIHESIGHPLELDRILGDERNFAGWSFVKPQDFNQLQYGSELMNVTFDPTVPGEFASYNFDDAGSKAEKQFLIKDGKLLRGLGSTESQARFKEKGLNIQGVANFRASSWNRAPIDRMANINLEPGSASLEKMIESTEKGILMESNISWSIDDYRRKFQFGCEYARLIEDGRLTTVVRSPNYRGVTVPFWNSLKAVGTADQVELYGSPYCGKGEPSQVIRVGHSAPYALFADIEVFGGAK